MQSVPRRAPRRRGGTQRLSQRISVRGGFSQKTPLHVRPCCSVARSHVHTKKRHRSAYFYTFFIPCHPVAFHIRRKRTARTAAKSSRKAVSALHTSRHFRFAAPPQGASVVRNAYRPPLSIYSTFARAGIRPCAMRHRQKSQQACWKRKTAVCMAAQRHYTDRRQNLPQAAQQDGGGRARRNDSTAGDRQILSCVTNLPGGYRAGESLQGFCRAFRRPNSPAQKRNTVPTGGAGQKSSAPQNGNRREPEKKKKNRRRKTGFFGPSE